MTAVQFENVDIVFGDDPKPALALLDQGKSRDAIRKETGSVVGVADATLDVAGGEICVLMGLSGSGKSTLLRCVNGLNRVTRGAIRVDGGDGPVDVASCDSKTLRRLRQTRVAMVFQQFGLLPWRTVAENVGFGLELRGVPAAEREATVKERLAMVDLAEWGDRYAGELSGGMQQRVGLARAFATDAPILLMDEPFSALDPLIRVRLQDELLELQERLQKTIIFVSHDLDEAMKLGNRIAIMEGGRIIQHGTPEDIVINPANDYVADFVSNLNPLHVLSAGTLMTPLAGLEQRDGGVVLDRAGRCVMRLNGHGLPGEVLYDGTALPPVEDGASEAPAGTRRVASVASDTSLREVVELRRRTGCPVLILEDGRPVGKIGEIEIYNGILKEVTR